MLNILHFSQDFREGKPQLGGYSRIFNETKDGIHNHVLFTFHFAERGIKRRQEGHIDVISIGIGVDRLSYRNKRKVGRILYKDILRYIQDHKLRFDLIFGHSQLFNAQLLIKINKSLNLPFLWEVNTIWGINEARGLVQNVIKWNSRRRMAMVFKSVDRIVAQTSNSKTSIEQHFNTFGKTIDVVTNALYLNSENKTVDKKFKLPYTILCLGLFDTMNGIKFLADQLKEIDTRNYKVIFVGDGLHKAHVLELANNGYCTYKKPIPHNEIPALYESVDFTIIPRLPALEADNFIPTKLLESMGYGTPVIGSDVKGISEVISHLENGFLFKAGNPNALVKCLNEINGVDPSLLTQISANAKNHIRTSYSWAGRHQQLNQIYLQLVNKL